MDNIFSRLVSLTSSLANRLIQFIEGLIYRDAGAYLEDYVLLSSTQRPCSTTRNSCRSSPSSKHVESYTNHPICSETISDLSVQLPVAATSLNVETRSSNIASNLFFKWLMLPLFSFQSLWRIVLAPWKCYFRNVRCFQAKVRRLIFRISKTLHGSSDDIGWMQRDPELAPVIDGTARFQELLETVRNGEHSLPNSFVYLLIPGLFSNHGPLYFVSTKRFFSKMGLACHIAKIHSEASVEHNALELKQYIEELYWGSGKRVMLLGHSKGGVDAAAALSLYSKDLKGKVAGLAFVQSPYGGTPVASDVLREGQIADTKTRKVMEFIVCKIVKGDIRSLEDLTYEKRKEFIKKHKFPDDIPIVSFHSQASMAPGVLTTMTHLAHAELPLLPFPRLSSQATEDDAVRVSPKLPIVVPVSAVMAICALHLQLRYGEKSDGLVTCRDAEVPGSVVVRPDRKLDHAWMVYSSWKGNQSEPDASEMCEALLMLLVEIGRKNKKQE